MPLSSGPTVADFGRTRRMARLHTASRRRLPREGDQGSNVPSGDSVPTAIIDFASASDRRTVILARRLLRFAIRGTARPRQCFRRGLRRAARRRAHDVRQPSTQRSRRQDGSARPGSSTSCRERRAGRRPPLDDLGVRVRPRGRAGLQGARRTASIGLWDFARPSGWPRPRPLRRTSYATVALPEAGWHNACGITQLCLLTWSCLTRRHPFKTTMTLLLSSVGGWAWLTQSCSATRSRDQPTKQTGPAVSGAWQLNSTRKRRTAGASPARRSARPRRPCAVPRRCPRSASTGRPQPDVWVAQRDVRNDLGKRRQLLAEAYDSLSAFVSRRCGRI